jgi:outer membrane protein insertion porin family
VALGFPGCARLGLSAALLSCAVTLIGAPAARAQSSPSAAAGAAAPAPDAASAEATQLEPSTRSDAADAEVAPGQDAAGSAPCPEPEVGVSPQANAPIRYSLEGIEIKGNGTRSRVIASFVPIKVGDQFDVDDPAIESARWRLLGTGWFDEVKLSLERGSRRGWVVLHIEVKERNTLLIDQFAAGLSRAVSNSMTTRDTVRPYVGLGLSESNLFGLGVGVSGSMVLTAQQYGVNLGYQDPMLAGSGFSLTGRIFHNYAREFFGRNPLVFISCPSPQPGEEPTPCDPDVEAKRAVVIYHRTGFGLGSGHEISSHLRYTIDWLGEYIDVLSKPTAASTQRGEDIVPIDFRINDGVSFVSSLRLGLIYDARDHPALTTHGDYVEFYARFGSRLFGSSYDFSRFEITMRHWVPLPWDHVISFGLFAGSVFGDPPFFYDFYAADLSDLLPSRVLELNLDRRRTLNLLGTSIVEMDMEDLAARLDFEYQLPLHRGGGFARGIDAYVGAGLFMLSRRKDLRVAISGYRGLARVPLDITFDLGVQADTEIGLFKLGFSSLIGFTPIGREDP